MRNLKNCLKEILEHNRITNSLLPVAVIFLMIYPVVSFLSQFFYIYVYAFTAIFFVLSLFGFVCSLAEGKNLEICIACAILAISNLKAVITYFNLNNLVYCIFYGWLAVSFWFEKQREAEGTAGGAVGQTSDASHSAQSRNDTIQKENRAERKVFCPGCGAQFRTNAKFCPVCGTKRPEEKPAPEKESGPSTNQTAASTPRPAAASESQSAAAPKPRAAAMSFGPAAVRKSPAAKYTGPGQELVEICGSTLVLVFNILLSAYLLCSVFGSFSILGFLTKIPMIILCIGCWMIYMGCINGTPKASGFSTVNTVLLIQQVVETVPLAFLLLVSIITIVAGVGLIGILYSGISLFIVTKYWNGLRRPVSGGKLLLQGESANWKPSMFVIIITAINAIKLAFSVLTTAGSELVAGSTARSLLSTVRNMIENVTDIPWLADYVTEYVGKMLGISTSVNVQLLPYLEAGVAVCALIILMQIRSRASELETEKESSSENGSESSDENNNESKNKMAE